MSFEYFLEQFKSENPHYAVTGNSATVIHFRYDTDEIGDSPVKHNEGLLSDIRAELEEKGIEIYDTQVEHDCITGSLRQLKISRADRDTRVTQLIADIRASHSIARRDYLFDAIVGVWELPLAD